MSSAEQLICLEDTVSDFAEISMRLSRIRQRDRDHGFSSLTPELDTLCSVVEYQRRLRVEILIEALIQSQAGAA